MLFLCVCDIDAISHLVTTLDFIRSGERQLVPFTQLDCSQGVGRKFFRVNDLVVFYNIYHA